MKVYENIFSYDYSFPAVTLAYFLRYPNPYSRHVLSTDVIDRYVDPVTHRLHTTRLHLKRSKIPSAMLKVLPAGFGGKSGASQSFILEKSTVDAEEGWMETESRNMEWTGILSVVERQFYSRQPLRQELTSQEGVPRVAVSGDKRDDRTDVVTTVTFKSKFGQAKRLRSRKRVESSSTSGSSSSESEEQFPRKGFLSTWSTNGIQRTIELIGVRRTREAVSKSKEGMNVVLERLRHGGVVAVLEGMRRDRETAFGSEGPWKRAWRQGNTMDPNHPRPEIDLPDDD